MLVPKLVGIFGCWGYVWGRGLRGDQVLAVERKESNLVSSLCAGFESFGGIGARFRVQTVVKSSGNLFNINFRGVSQNSRSARRSTRRLLHFFCTVA